MFDEWWIRFEVNRNHIHPDRMLGILLREPPGELTQFVLFMAVDHLLWGTKKTTALGFDLDQHDRLFVLR